MRSFLGSRRAQVTIPRLFRSCNNSPQVPGHKGALAFGLLGSGGGVPTVAMLGRVSPRFQSQAGLIVVFAVPPI